ncbi:MAG: hypothetical protein JSS53_09430 [Proteobacteria bacterium]|nr:hypothetical protein [Pseudomonadota bacterium]
MGQKKRHSNGRHHSISIRNSRYFQFFSADSNDSAKRSSCVEENGSGLSSQNTTVPICNSSKHSQFFPGNSSDLYDWAKKELRIEENDFLRVYKVCMKFAYTDARYSLLYSAYAGAFNVDYKNKELDFTILHDDQNWANETINRANQTLEKLLIKTHEVELEMTKNQLNPRLQDQRIILKNQEYFLRCKIDFAHAIIQRISHILDSSSNRSNLEICSRQAKLATLEAFDGFSSKEYPPNNPTS